MDISRTHLFSMKKPNNSANFAAGGIIDCSTHHKHSIRDENEQLVAVEVMVDWLLSYIKLLRKCNLRHFIQLVAKNKRRLLSEQPLYLGSLVVF
jgi:hypothetical protein